MAQGVIGYVQYFTHLPAALVDLHMFGACLVWIATLRVLLSFRRAAGRPTPRPRQPAGPGRGPAAAVRQPVDAARVPLADQGGDPLPVRR